MDEDYDDLPEVDALLRAEKKHEWISEPRFKRMFVEIEDGLQGVLGKGKYEWVDRRVFDQVFDRSTLLAVHKLMQKGQIETIDYPIARGKEAHVFNATTNHGPVAVKIFHTTNAVFKGLAKYIDGDPRFKGLSRRHRELVNIWVRKEFRNLQRMRKHGLRVPEPLDSLKNVLVMEYIGDEKGPSPRLKEISVDNPYEVFEELLDFISINWHKCNLVHADFSEYNILLNGDDLWIIDAGQSVTRQHPNAEEFLVRDVTRIVSWINRQGHNVDLAESLARVLDDPVPEASSVSGGD